MVKLEVKLNFMHGNTQLSKGIQDFATYEVYFEVNFGIYYAV